MPLKTDEHPSDQSEGDKPAVQVGDIFCASFGVEILKAEESDDGDTGHVEAIVSAFDVDYRMGWMTKHRITANAFKASLAESATIPIFFQHNWSWSEQPPIGTGLASAVASPKPGLKVSSDLFLDTESGRSTFRAIKAGALREWSIGYRITKYEVEEDDDGFDVVIVNEADLMEASSVLRGANPDTETLKVARELPPEFQETMAAAAAFMQASTATLDLLGERITGIETAHDVLVASLEDGDFETNDKTTTVTLPVNEITITADGDFSLLGAESGGSVEPAVGGGSEAEPEEAAPQAESVPDSPSPTSEADRLDRAYQRAVARVASKWENFVEQAGVGLENPDAKASSREDIESMERVIRCLNLTKHTYDAVEHRVTARVLAESASC